MSSPVVTTTVDSNVAYVRELMERKDVGAIPVVEQAEGHIKLRGIITRYDLCGILNESTPVTEIMSDQVQEIHPDSSAFRAANLMTDHGIHHLVVKDHDRIVGIISTMDFVRLVSEKKNNRLASVVFV